MLKAGVMNQVRIEDFERFHAKRLRKAPPPASLKEIAITVLLAIIVVPFMYVTFMCIPMMGVVTVGFSLFITSLYLFFRRSLLILAAALFSSGALAGLFFVFVQSVKYRMDVTLFVLIALGIPVTIIYTTFVGMRIWEIRGGAE
jgi:hypothetical protein